MRHTDSSASAEPLDARLRSPSSRIVWIESARGLGILMVVVGHVLHGLTAHGLMAEGPLHRIWDGEYYNVRMPLFFVLSGLFAERQASRGGRSFLAGKASALLYPYLVWAGLMAIVRIAVAVLAGRRPPIEYLSELAVYPPMQFWFIYVLFFVSFLHFGLRRAGLGPTACVAVTLVFYGFRPWGDENIQTSTMPMLRILYYAPFYAVGALAGLHLARLRVEGTPRLLAVALAGLAVIVASARWLDDPPLALQMVVTLCGVVGLIALSSLLSRLSRMGFLRALGRRSLEIYVVHMFAVESVRPALVKLLHVQDPSTHLAVGVAAGLACPLALVWFCDRFDLKYVFRLPKTGAVRPRPTARRDPDVVMA